MSKPLLVMKFGGTSVGSPERIETAARLIAQSAASHSVVVVLSAMSKVTDLLLNTLNLAEQGQLEDVERGQCHATGVRDSEAEVNRVDQASVTLTVTDWTKSEKRKFSSRRQIDSSSPST